MKARHRKRRPVLWAVSIVMFSSGCDSLGGVKTLYLDSALASDCADGSYSIISRDCSGEDGPAYRSIAAMNARRAFRTGDTLYLRAGTYTGPPTGEGHLGQLVAPGGRPENPTVIEAFGGEPVVICSQDGACSLDSAWDSSPTTQRFFGNPAVSVFSSHVRIRGIKTFGGVLVRGAGSVRGHIRDVVIENSDLAGCGVLAQGHVLRIEDAYDVTVRDNVLHHSCWGQSDKNGPILGGYDASYTVEHNEFYDAWSDAVQTKDTGEQSRAAGAREDRKIVVRYNLFRPSSLRRGAGGLEFCNQDCTADMDVYGNVFVETAVRWYSSNTVSRLYRNTFIDGGVSVPLPQGVQIFNNLFSHNRRGGDFIRVNRPEHDEPMLVDYNCYHATAGGGWLWGTRSTRKLERWRKVSGQDRAAINLETCPSGGPDFVGLDRTRADSFRRTRTCEQMTASPFGPTCGAYGDGETVGPRVDGDRAGEG